MVLLLIIFYLLIIFPTRSSIKVVSKFFCGEGLPLAANAASQGSGDVVVPATLLQKLFLTVPAFWLGRHYHSKLPSHLVFEASCRPVP